MKSILDSKLFNIVKDPFINLAFYDNEYLPNNTYDFYKSDGPSPRKTNDFTYSLNNYGLRSDDFNKDIANKNFLFAGCSQTVVLGLPLELGWANIVNSHFDMGSFLNIADVALSIDIIVNNIISYINLFGAPKAIFVLFPDFNRVTVMKNNNITTDWIELKLYESKKDHLDEILLKEYFSLKALETICKINSIPLLYSSWQRATVEVFNTFKEKGLLECSFDIYDNYDLKVEDYDKSSSKYPNYWKNARDRVHFGERWNRYFADSFIKQIEKMNLNA